MNKTKTLIITAFVLAFCAGIPFGWAMEGWLDRPSGDSWLSRRLDLSPGQEQKVNEIWSGVVKEPHEDRRARMHGFAEERDNGIRAMLTDDQIGNFDQIMEGYHAARSEFFQEIRARHDAAVEQTKALLTEDQRKKYDEMIERRRSRDSSMFGFGHGSQHQKNQNN